VLRLRPTLACALLGALLAPAADAGPRAFTVQSGRAQVKLVYTLGTHEENATQLSGTVRLDPETLTGAAGALIVPIASIIEDHGARDCHLREALGLDYAAADYPATHSCGSDDKLPASGPRAIVHPEIRFELSASKPLDDLKALAEGKAVRVEVDGAWTIHGKTRPAKLLLRVKREGASLRVKGQTAITLADHDVQVKSARILFAEITVGPVAGVEVDLLLSPKE
jgi:polyisoprenoid-binding protein YceI